MEGGGEVPVLLDHGRIGMLADDQLVAIVGSELSGRAGRAHR